LQFFVLSNIFRTLLQFVAVISCAVMSQHASSATNDAQGSINANIDASVDIEKVRSMIGQKVILDFRYFCDDGTVSRACRTPMTRIPKSLLSLLSKNNIGGVILFSENITSASQLITLNHAMQQHMVESGRAPLFIAVDQEGGRVARLPYDMLAPFSGNMAIGASFHKHGTAFATNVAAHIGQTLLPLGINTNFAPSVDVNSEPKNPVINIRSFSQHPEQVAALGQAFVSSMQQSGVISAIKHFPGHGDTQVDSHSGLPSVSHSKAHATATDVLPFANIINSGVAPAMVMSAHIQYPSLDSTSLIDKHGKAQVVPATLSKKILTELLRKQLGFQGLVVTDALDMAGISQFFTQEDAMLNAYRAGADIALMPFTIRTPNDINQFETLLTSISQKVVKDKTLHAHVQRSQNRIASTKQRFALHKFVTKPVSWWLDEAAEKNNKQSASALKAKGLQLQKALSEAAVTTLYGKQKLPLVDNRFVAFMPDSARCYALEHALTASLKTALPDKSLQFACLPLLTLPKKSLVKRLVNDTDVIVVGDISPRHANYELGGIDNVEIVKQRTSLSHIHAFMKDTMHYAKGQGKTVVFLPLRMPFIAEQMKEVSDIALASFSYVTEVSAEQDTQVKATSDAMQALTDALLGVFEPDGRSPVKMNAQH